MISGEKFVLFNLWMFIHDGHITVLRIVQRLQVKTTDAEIWEVSLRKMHRRQTAS